MADQTLLQRLANDVPLVPGKPPDTSAIIDSILESMQTMMNTRQGAALARPDFGLPDFNDLAAEFPAAVPAIARAIKYQIDTFEPRLRNVVVRHVPDPDNPLQLSFRVRAEMILPEVSDSVTFETVFGSDGSVHVQ